METKSLVKPAREIPALFDDFFRPFNDWFGGSSLTMRSMNIPAVNIAETNSKYEVSLAVPGLKKEDFKINIEGDMLTISSEQEAEEETNEEKWNRKEYNYSSFSRSFNLPEEINQEKIEANYNDGILKINLPKKEKAATVLSKNIAVN
jgi:HSP20 family protein